MIDPDTKKKIDIQLQICDEEINSLSDWELNFIASLQIQVSERNFISEKQVQILQKIYDKVA